jgi:hypothetical protein
MPKKPKPPRVTKAVMKRVQRAGYDQARHGRCIVCGGDWDDCPHNRAQIAVVIDAVRMAEALGIELPN